jgi:ubiquinone/menaquinone biosynthesis C-methylase UbiE
MANSKPLIHWTPEMYSKLSSSYDALAPIFFSMGEKAKHKVANQLSSGSVLDIACGTGALLASAQDKGLRCFGIDTSIGMIEVARKKVPGGKFKIGSFYDLPYAENSFDNVVETNAVSGISVNVEQVISEMLRVCKPGGKILIGDYCSPPKDNLVTQVMIWIGHKIGDHPNDFSLIFKKLGCDPVVEILGWGGIFQVISVRIP